MTIPGIAAHLEAAADVSVLSGPDAERFSVDGVAPAVVARPMDEAGVSAVLTAASEAGLAVVPWGGGTCMDIGNRPRRVDVVLDMSALDAVVEYRPRDMTVTAQAGATVAALQRVLDSEGQFLALDPPLPERATIGGAVAANASGPRRFRFGTARDIVIGTGAVLADGTAIKSGGRVVKNVAGYDLNKLFIGSGGTLGVISRLTFKLLPSQPEHGLVVAAFDDVMAACGAARAIVNGVLAPWSVDVSGPGAIGGLDEALPEARGSWNVVVEFAGTAAAVDRTRGDLLALFHGLGCRMVFEPDGSARGAIIAGTRDFGLNGETRLMLRAAVLPSEVLETCVMLERAAWERGTGCVIVARAGNGVVLSAWPITDPDVVRGLVAQLRDRLRRSGGMLVVERCPPEAKQGLDVWGIGGPDVSLMRRLKQQFDPSAVLSPGRGVGGI
ncbi:MAG: FAD-binding oxidoreductase [Chloroflexi bacterium]|nr:FAD-binding oxidoreductase [Chloroflexota bacterium]